MPPFFYDFYDNLPTTFASGQINVDTVTARLVMSAGNDDVTVSVYVARIEMREGDDYVGVHSGTNLGIVDLGSGDDTFFASSSGRVASLFAGSGNDTVQSNADLTTVDLGTGDDVISAGRVGTLFAGDGNDDVRITDLGRADLGSGNDRLEATHAGSVDAGEGNDVVTLFGSGSIFGGAGDDVLRFNVPTADGTVTFDGGDGFDVVELVLAASAAAETIAAIVGAASDRHGDFDGAFGALDLNLAGVEQVSVVVGGETYVFGETDLF